MAVIEHDDVKHKVSVILHIAGQSMKWKPFIGPDIMEWNTILHPVPLLQQDIGPPFPYAVVVVVDSDFLHKVLGVTDD